MEAVCGEHTIDPKYIQINIAKQCVCVRERERYRERVRERENQKKGARDKEHYLITAIILGQDHLFGLKFQLFVVI